MIRCACQDCCARREHFARADVAGREAHRRWTVSRTRSHVSRCPTCDQWFVEAVR